MKRQREHQVIDSNSIDLAQCLMLLSHQNPKDQSKVHHYYRHQKHFRPTEFECSTCNRKFSSFQALGGHKASHKKQKMEKNNKEEATTTLSLGVGNNNNVFINKPNNKMHECSICGQRFSQGQALGGHMRKHRLLTNQETFLIPSTNDVVLGKIPPVLKRSNSFRVMCLDLNLTPLQNDLKVLFGNMAPKVDPSWV
ncbi:zinc finger protein ZAT11-like [Arachis stenosperma]|uniref:zinc finger protein ZAT11-like n=1 Tax=Arachis stenosperma TaxID=217475 RepID=UPI0025AC7803|nr:zinc finger protein ZAT11-like [Arachis stenosperma]